MSVGDDVIFWSFQRSTQMVWIHDSAH